jgi:Rrf2 family protein
MNLIHRDTDYALRALIYIAKHRDTVVPAQQVQNELNLPRPFLRKILQTLQKAGILDSRKGNKGGFWINKNPEVISLADIMVIFQGKLSMCECFLMKKICPHVRTCKIRAKVKAIEKNVIQELNQITIADLLKKSHI